MKVFVIIFFSLPLGERDKRDGEMYINDILDGRRRSTRDVGTRSHTTGSEKG